MPSIELNLLVLSLIVLAFSVVFAVVGYLVRKSIAERKISSAEQAAKQIIDDATREAETNKKEAILEVKDEVHKLRSDAEATYVSEEMRFRNKSIVWFKKKRF